MTIECSQSELSIVYASSEEDALLAETLDEYHDNHRKTHKDEFTSYFNIKTVQYVKK